MIDFYLYSILLLFNIFQAGHTIENSPKKHFLDSTYSLEYLKKFQSRLDCIHQNGHWKFNSSLSPPELSCETAFSRGGGGLCNQTLTNIPGYRYYWDAPTCDHISPFSFKSLCHIMNGRSILLVGDSLTTEFSINLLNTISNYAKSDGCIIKKIRSYDDVKHDIPCSKYAPNTKDFSIIAVRSDRLNLNENISIKGREFIEYSWVKYLKMDRNKLISLIVLNRGAHYENNELLLSAVKRAFDYITNSHPNALIVWRNSKAGFMDYMEHFYDTPLTSAPPPLDDPYNYTLILSQNMLMRDFIRDKFQEWNILYWDIYNMTSVRRDTHRDPMHPCQIGVMETWVLMFYNIIKLLSSEGNKL